MQYKASVRNEVTAQTEQGAEIQHLRKLFKQLSENGKEPTPRECEECDNIVLVHFKRREQKAGA